MQKLINEYFEKLSSNIFFKNDDETIIGRSKNVIDNLKEQLKYAKKDLDSVEEMEELKIITTDIKSLIKEIKKQYKNKNDVIMLSFHPMAGFYTLQSQEKLLEELEDYIDEMEEI